MAHMLMVRQHYHQPLVAHMVMVVMLDDALILSVQYSLSLMHPIFHMRISYHSRIVLFLLKYLLFSYYCVISESVNRNHQPDQLYITMRNTVPATSARLYSSFIATVIITVVSTVI